MRFQYAQRFVRRAIAVRGAVGLLSTLAVGMLCITTVQPMSALPARLLDDTVYTLERVYTKGEADHYKVKTEVKTDGKMLPGVTKIIISMVFKEQTREVKADGNAVIDDTFEQASADVGKGVPLDMAPFMPVITQTRDKQSHILENKTVGGNGTVSDMVAQYAKQLIFFYADKPVKVGDSWTLEDKDATAPVPIKTLGKGTLLAIETLNGVQTAKIKVVTDAGGETEDPNTHVRTKVGAHFEATGNMDLKTGKILLMMGKTTFTGGTLLENQVDWKLKAGDNKDDAAPADKGAAKTGGR
jgi:hypothetical protein